MSKITKGIQDKETFTRTKCTSTFVIYKYSSPSSFQLSENKKSKCKEQLKIRLHSRFGGQIQWNISMWSLCLTVHSIYTTVHIYRCNLPAQVYTSVMQDPPLASAMASDHGQHTHAHSHTYTRLTRMHVWLHTSLIIISVQSDITHTHPLTCTLQHDAVF